MKKIINSLLVPQAIGPYCQAVLSGNTLYISGQLPVCVDKEGLVDNDINQQTHQVLKNIGHILKEAGFAYTDVVKTTCLLSDMSNFAEFNTVYASYFTSDCPARATFAVKALPLNALVEIEAIAVK